MLVFGITDAKIHSPSAVHETYLIRQHSAKGIWKHFACVNESILSGHLSILYQELR
jgi:hypothetical protein